GPAAQGPIRPWRTNGRRVWTAGSTSGGTRAPSKARSHGHPGGWSRERYLTLLREWVGRGVPVPDPYDEKLIASAPREIRLALADAQAEEATATLLADLGSAFTIWHDVATDTGMRPGPGMPRLRSPIRPNSTTWCWGPPACWWCSPRTGEPLPARRAGI